MSTPALDEVVVDEKEDKIIVSSYTVDPSVLFVKCGNYEVFIDEGEKENEEFMIHFESSEEESDEEL